MESEERSYSDPMDPEPGPAQLREVVFVSRGFVRLTERAKTTGGERRNWPEWKGHVFESVRVGRQGKSSRPGSDEPRSHPGLG